jgi:hypothetical protein
MGCETTCEEESERVEEKKRGKSRNLTQSIKHPVLASPNPGMITQHRITRASTRLELYDGKLDPVQSKFFP